MQCLMDKQQIFASLYETVMEQETPHKGLLLRGDATDLQQGETLLKGALNEGKSMRQQHQINFYSVLKISPQFCLSWLE